MHHISSCRDAEADRLRATIEQTLDLMDYPMPETNYDRALRRAKERGKKKGWTEVKIQEQAEKRRFWRGIGETVARVLVGIGLKKGTDAIKRL